jgi:hypothetical protein
MKYCGNVADGSTNFLEGFYSAGEVTFGHRRRCEKQMLLRAAGPPRQAVFLRDAESSVGKHVGRARENKRCCQRR